MMEILQNYGPNAIAAIIALIYLLKDWESFRKQTLRFSALFFILLLCIAGIYSTHSTNVKNDNNRAADKVQIRALQSAISSASKSQSDNTKQFLYSFDRLSQKVSTLQTKVMTAGLQKEAEQLKAELISTQKAMNQPKARLDYVFGHPKNINFNDLPTKKVSLPIINDVVHVDFSYINPTEIPARDGDLTITICDQCSFASEPKGFERLADQKSTARYKSFGRILQHTIAPTMSVDIKVPSNITSIPFAATYRCDNCDVPESDKYISTIDLSR